MVKKQVKNNKNMFSKGRTALLTLLASLGVVSAVGMTRTVVNNDGPDNPKDKKEVVADVARDGNLTANLPTDPVELERFIKMADETLAELNKKIENDELNPEEEFYARITIKNINAERAECIRRLGAMQQANGKNGR